MHGFRKKKVIAKPYGGEASCNNYEASTSLALPSFFSTASKSFIKNKRDK